MLDSNSFATLREQNLFQVPPALAMPQAFEVLDHSDLERIKQKQHDKRAQITEVLQDNSSYIKYVSVFNYIHIL